MRHAVWIGWIALGSAAGCGPSVSVDVAVENGSVVFHVPHRGINGLLGFQVQDVDGTLLWQASFDYEQGERIVYGVLPGGGNSPARQLIPADGTAPPDIRGKSVKVQVIFQYDGGAAHAGGLLTTLQIP